MLLNFKKIIFFAAAGLIIFSIGGGAGVLYQQNKETPAVQPAENQSTKILSSKVISSMVGSGEVSNIEGKNITLTFGGDSLTVKIRDDAGIISLAPVDKKGNLITPVEKKINFEDIKKGDYININLRILPDGKLEGERVAVSSVKN